MSLLIDADFIVYKCCAANETEVDYGSDVIVVTSRFSEAYDMVRREIEKIQRELYSDDVNLFFSSATNFRKRVDPEYKGHRNRKKPCGYLRVINKLMTEYVVIMMPDLEADDAIGIAATNPQRTEDHTICSPDKDLRQIPGQLYDNMTGEIHNTTEEQGRKWHLIQTLAGDQTDGYSGAPGFGVKRAEDFFKKEGYTWDAVVKAFESKDLTEDDALRNARLAKILQHSDYDFTDQRPRLWDPRSNRNSNDGAAVQAQAD
jgi:DNA polymerase-1